MSDKASHRNFFGIFEVSVLREKYSLASYDFRPLSKASQRTTIMKVEFLSENTTDLKEADAEARSRAMTIFDAREKIELIASQNFKYDCYSGYKYYLERIDVDGKSGLVCVEEQENCCSHATVVLEPIYNDIKVCKISTIKANYDRYVVYANGKRLGEFTMVINEWIPQCNN